MSSAQTRMQTKHPIIEDKYKYIIKGFLLKKIYGKVFKYIVGQKTSGRKYFPRVKEDAQTRLSPSVIGFLPLCSAAVKPPQDLK